MASAIVTRSSSIASSTICSYTLAAPLMRASQDSPVDGTSATISPTCEPAGKPLGLPGAVAGTPAFPPVAAFFVVSAPFLSERCLMAASLVSRVRYDSEAVDVDHRQLGRRRWEDPSASWTWTSSPQAVGGPPTDASGGRSSGSPRCVRIFLTGPLLREKRNSPDVAATRWALQRKLLSHPRPQFCLGN